MDGPELQRLTRQVHADSTVSRLLFGRCLLAIDRCDQAGALGFSGSIHYAIHLGTDAREAVEMRRVAKCLELLPRLRGAAESGEVGWSSLREIVRKATPDTDQRWLELALAHNYRTIERLVRRTRRGEEPSDEGCEEREPVEVELRAVLPAEVMLLWQRAVVELCQQAGRKLTMAQIFECVCLEVLAGTSFPSDKVRGDLYDRVRRDQAAQSESEQREVEAALAVEKPARVSEELVAPWAAVAAEEEPCPSDPELSIVRQAAAHWQNDGLRFSEKARVVTPAQRQEILRRDAYCCAAPGCPNHLWLEVHHIVFYCSGGVTLPHNLLTLCSRCHRNLHLGRLRVTGQAPERLVWRDGSGRRLGSGVATEKALAATG